MNRPLDRSDDPAPVQIPLTGILQSGRRISIASPCSDAMALASDVDRYRRASSILDILRRLDHASLDEVIVMGRALARLEVIRANADITIEAPTWSALDEALMLELTDVRLEREHAAAVAEDAARDVERQIACITGRSANTTAPGVPGAEDCSHPLGHWWMVRGPIKECRLCGVSTREPPLAPTDADMIGSSGDEVAGPCECQPSAPGAPRDPAPCGASDCFIAPVGGEG